MKLPADILRRIAADFPRSEFAETVRDALEGLAVPEPERVARCVLFAAEGDPVKFKQMMELARVDYRDAIMCGEYDPGTQKRVRNLAEPFVP